MDYFALLHARKQGQGARRTVHCVTCVADPTRVVVMLD